eukprot:CAMPEP_0117451782 /NCGR_PEP_ID=MMETSP0759-20121206/9201_1 /TAXON_ID=63605 /ORGANISM="Percolomonas cosmopolitus, Strain WS" /LENGTH=361 /DNA_ID=CAMNT_0005244425 /DNA_START=146 /DNA_END=1230 /DNA_ORIENTATION=+
MEQKCVKLVGSNNNVTVPALSPLQSVSQTILDAIPRIILFHSSMPPQHFLFHSSKTTIIPLEFISPVYMLVAPQSHPPPFPTQFHNPKRDLLKKRENDTEEYREKWNKMGTVPVLVVREMGGKERRISQSMAAMELLNTLMEGSSHQAHQQLILPSLNDKSLRSDMVPLLQALIVEFAEVINSGMQPMQNTKVLRMVKDSFKAQQGSEHSDPKNLSKELDDRVKREWTEVHLRKGCSKLEHMLRDNRGNESFYEEIPREDQDALAPFYCIGRRLSIADLCFVPQIYAVATRTSIDLAKEFPMVWQTYEKLQGLACFVETDPDHAAKREEYVFEHEMTKKDQPIGLDDGIASVISAMSQSFW